MSEALHLHPSIDNGLTKEAEGFAGGTLVCHCTDRPVKVAIDNQVLFNHACGCTKCWKPAGALFSVVGVVPEGKVRVLEKRRQTRRGRSVRTDPAPRLPRVRRSYVWAGGT